MCGETGAGCHGSVPVLLSADQLADIGLKPDQLTPGGTIAMADQTEPKGRYPRQEVTEGQKHGYIGEVEVYDPPQSEAGYSNAETDTTPSSSSRSSKTTTTKATAKDSEPPEKPIVGSTGVVGGTVDNVGPPKK